MLLLFKVYNIPCSELALGAPDSSMLSTRKINSTVLYLKYTVDCTWLQQFIRDIKRLINTMLEHSFPVVPTSKLI